MSDYIIPDEYCMVGMPESTLILLTKTTIIFDISGSMGEKVSTEVDPEQEFTYSRIDIAKHSFLACIESLKLGGAFTFIIFNSTYSTLYETDCLTPSGKVALIEKLNKITADGGTDMLTPLLDTMLLHSANPLINSTVQHTVFLFTDGEQTSGPTIFVSEMIRRFEEVLESKPSSFRNLQINVFGFGNALNMGFIQCITQHTKGAFAYISDGSMIANVVVSTFTSLYHKPTIDHDLHDTLINNLIQMLNSILNSTTRSERESFLTNFTSFMSSLIVPTRYSTFFSSLTDDLANTSLSTKGQIYKASLQYFDSWGKYYLLALITAYSNGVVINDKDTSLDIYRTVEFIEAKERMIEIFNTLPAIKPTARITKPTSRTSHYTTGTTSSASSRSSVVASTPSVPSTPYRYTADLGCYSGTCQVSTPNGPIYFKNIKKGDELYAMKGLEKCIDVVKCVIKIPCKQKLYGDFTAWHPILDCGVSCFPSNVYQESELTCEYVYDVVMQNRTIIKIENGSDLYGATYGQQYGSLMHDEVFEHSFFGTEKIVDKLKEAPGYTSGYVELPKDSAFVRDFITDKVVDLVFSSRELN